MTLSLSTAMGIGACGCIVAGAACATVAQPGPTKHTVSETLAGGAHPTAEGRLDLAGTSPHGSVRPSGSGAIVSPPPTTSTPHWSYVTTSEGTAAGGGLYTALDGMCGHVSVSLFQNEAVVMLAKARRALREELAVLATRGALRDADRRSQDRDQVGGRDHE